MQYGKKKYTFHKAERLYLRKDIDTLFKENTSFIAYPLRVIYSEKLIENLEGIETEKKYLPQILISVSKKMLKRANKRNRIKRLIRESYRLNKHIFDEKILTGRQLTIGFIYLKKELSDFNEIESSIKKTIKLISKKINDEKNLD